MRPFLRSGSRVAALTAILAMAIGSDAGALAAGDIAPLPKALQRPALAVANPASANLQAVVRAGGRLVAAGERGLVIYSDDSGAHWKQARVPVSVTLTALRFKAGGQEGWAVGNMGAVLRTTDAGASWTRVFDGRAAATLAVQAARQARDAGKPDPADAEHPLNRLLEDAQRLADEGADKPFLDIALRADGSVLVVGAYGLAYTTADGGRTWRALMQDLPNPEGVTWYGIAERGQERYLFGEQGVLLRASGAVGAAGAFTEQASPATGSLFGSLALDDGTLLLFGLRGKVYRSVAPGAPWTEAKNPVDASLIA
ncbi:MAG TPA: YCF48-related protein, partial [Pseudoduganella sp.]